MKNLFLIIILSMFSEAKVHIMQGTLQIQKEVNSWIEIKNKNLTRQKHDYSCGSASLSTIITYYYDKNMTEKKILDAVMDMKGITQDNIVKKAKEENGLSFLDLSDFSQKNGFKALGLALDIDALRKLQIPVILYVKIRNNEHFTVYKGMDSRYAYLADPSFGNTKIRISKFKEMFYQREDIKYPGKILAILPVNQGEKVNKNFMKVKKQSDIIYESINIQMLK